MIKSVSAVAIAMAGLSATPAMAICPDDKSGWYYVYDSCVQKESYSPSGVCQVEQDEETRIVVIVSNVFRDVNDYDYPHSLFYDAAAAQLDTSVSGEVSNCYATHREAAKSRQQYLADARRYLTDPKVVTVSIPGD